MFWYVLCGLAVLLAALVVWGRLERDRVRLTRYVVSSARLPAGLDGLKIAHLSDIHYSGEQPAERKALELVRDVAPDVVLFTGDLLRYVECAPMAIRYLAEFRAPMGVVAVLGNHDRRLSLTEGWLETELRALGIRVLLNESLSLRRDDDELWAIGVDDPHSGLDCLHCALEGVPPNAYRIVLAHTPGLYRGAMALEVDLVLSGHTHGGQVRLPLLGPVVTNVPGLPRRLGAGLTRLSDRTTLIVSHGIGLTWFQLRLFCPPEVVMVELRRAQA